MQYTTAALCLISATLSLAAPTTKRDTFSGFIVPSVLKIHDINSNANVASLHTATVRAANNVETSTLYQIPIPASLAGKTCALVIQATAGDQVQGTQELDIFNNLFADLNNLPSGNQRNQQLARVKFNSGTGFYDFDTVGFANPKIQSFPCPAGATLKWESVAVGTFDVNVISQDFANVVGAEAPNGLSVGYF
ncbi:uncharacterized protein GGS22DRAFT_144096 [Annulohypoxylon maeteangense]|uniref:uncharacterized protein n=1 Tax=Annulohypoxylon maeteangense TaxID=1927788 RepID=UPI0020075035|nr:uncharacterized protein GGS22DRAFT_144096 [Annulohypoxylon maeteangense]KAI0884556.1 hypothetical protein GGS22DRAFT_144096 [Annulohypoxylon maeteangense]